VIAGDHDRSDPSRSAGLDGALRFRTRRIDHANQAQEDQLTVG